LKRLILIILIVLAVVSLNNPIFAKEDKGTSKVVAYYFHGTFRCYTCNMIERNTKEAIEESFKEALASGRLEFKSVNVEALGNEHFAREYKLYSKAVVLSLVKDGKEVKSKNLTEIWQYSRNKKTFSEYIVKEVNNFLNEV